MMAGRIFGAAATALGPSPTRAVAADSGPANMINTPAAAMRLVLFITVSFYV